MALRGHRRDPLDIGEVGVSGRLGHPLLGEREWIKLDTGLRDQRRRVGDRVSRCRSRVGAVSAGPRMLYA